MMTFHYQNYKLHIDSNKVFGCHRIKASSSLYVRLNKGIGVTVIISVIPKCFFNPKPKPGSQKMTASIN